MTRAAQALRVALTLAVLAGHALAQDPRLSGRLDRPTMLAVTAIIDSARAAHLPTAPLIDKALEGAAKGSDGPRIVVAVKQLSVRMALAKRVLGAHASTDEIRGAAGAINAGVSPRDLARLHAAAGKRSLTMPLAVVSDLIGESIAAPAVSNLVVQLLKSHVSDRDLSLFQRNVRTDVERGADPTVAATTRTRGLVLRSSGPASKPSE